MTIFSKAWFAYFRLALLVLALSACAQRNEGISEADSKLLRPADAELSAIYDRSCRSCHTLASTGSPLTGDSAAWAPRLDKGMEQLLDNVINGFGGMPPLGLCMDCNAEQFEALINFMAAAPSPGS